MANHENKHEKDLKAPKIPKNGLAKGLPDDTIQDQAYYTRLILAHENLTGQAASHLTFDQVLFQYIRMSDAQFKKVQLLDSRFTTCDLANTEWTEANVRRVELIDCQLTGFHAIEAIVQDTLFKGCKGSFAQFRFATLKQVRFEHCDLSEADFQEANLSDVTFIGCNLHNVEMSGAKLARVDLRGSKIDGLRAGLNELKGAILDPGQALAFVRGIGIRVEPPEKEL